MTLSESDLSEPTTDDQPDEREVWAVAAREVLIKVAGRYHRVTTYKDLASAVQTATGVTTSRQPRLWLGDVLDRVSADGVERGEPLLASLCVDATGAVNGMYANAVAAAGGTVEGDADDAAAAHRLECYRYFEAENLPENGGVAAVTPRLAAARERAWKPKPITTERAICPNCFMEIPPTGKCDNCA